LARGFTLGNDFREPGDNSSIDTAMV
jgi:hypothetical protein